MKRLSMIMAGIMAAGMTSFFFLGMPNNSACRYFGIPQADASPEITKLSSALVWRADGQGDYLFQGNGTLRGVKIASDGAVEYVSAPGTYELNAPYLANSLILSLAANWSFSGKVTLEVNVTGDANDYLPVINGVPRQWNARFGSRIKWRATLTEGSKLNAVRITYKDIAGTAGSWGNPKLSGFGFRKPVSINGSSLEELFNEQVRIKVGESQAEDCDLNLKGVISADFKDVRFTQADAETLLPHYLENISEAAGKQRVATFWVKIPQLPADGLPIYIYYGKSGAEDLSNGKEAFDFFEDFSHQGGIPQDAGSATGLNEEAWQAYDFKQGILEYKLKSENEIKSLDMTTLTKEEIITFFKTGKEFEWARVRGAALPAPLVDKEKTAAASEEVPNLADFAGVDVAPDGDLVLEEGALQGEYTSVDIFSPFKARIMVPGWKAVTATGAQAALDISANAGADFKTNCFAEKYYYASRKDFSPGDSLKWRLNLTRTDTTVASSRLKEFSLDFRPGVISVLSPEDKEQLVAGSTYTLKWSAQEYEPSYVMGIAYSLDAGKNYAVLTENVLNTGKYSWIVPQQLTKKALLKVYDKLDPNIYDTSNGYFSIVEKISGSKEEAGEEETAGQEVVVEAGLEPEAVVEEAKEKAKAGLYDILIKIDDKKAKKVSQKKEFYQEGDIVMIKPTGYLWGAEEKEKFLLVQAYLSEAEAKELILPEESVVGTDEKGRPIKKLIQKRKYKIDLAKQGLLAQKEPALRGLLSSKPLVSRGGIEEKVRSYKSEVKGE